MTDATTSDVFVSLQAPGHGYDFVQGHRTAGLLVTANSVVFPDVPRALVGRVTECAVLLVPIASGGQRAEAIKASYAEVHAVEGEQKMTGLVCLARPATAVSRATTLPGGRDFEVDLQEHGGDLLAVLEMRGVATSALDLDPAVVLADVVATPAESEKVVVHWQGEDWWTGIRWCDFFGCC